MLRWIALAVVMVALIAAATVVMQFAPASSDQWKLPIAAENKGPMPKVVVEGDLTYEFGTMTQQSEGKHSWLFRNEGEGNLELWKGTSTCMCTFAQFKNDQKAILKPGESTDIEVVWRTNYTNGEFKKGANIETNDPNTPTVPLFVHGTINPPVMIRPGELVDLHAVDVLDSKGADVALYSDDRPDLKLTKIMTSKPGLLVAEAAPMTPDDLKALGIKGGLRVHINVKPGFPIGTMREEVVLQTDHPQRPEVKLTVVGSIAGPISVLPERVRMVNVKTSEGAAKEITLLVRGGKSAHFEVVKQPEAIGVTIEPGDSDADRKGRYLVKINVPKGAEPGYIEDTIVIKSDFPNVGELKIPVNILISAD